ncbi:MAG: AI-2E family transporter [Legionellaceae bacterium]|nr:AI-2E family transporter [Legionellaceae bacterium]
MNDNYKELLSIVLTIAIILAALEVVYRFLPSIFWAGIIAVAIYPVYQRWNAWFGGHSNIASALFTLLLSLFFILPLTYFVSILLKEGNILVHYLHKLNTDGGHPPAFLIDIPFIGDKLEEYWQFYLSQPGNIQSMVSNIHVPMTPFTHFAKEIGADIAHRGIQLGFTVVTLFFFLRDGVLLYTQIQRIGAICLGKRWFHYANRLPSALRATVNGTIVVGFGVGLCMGIGYALVQFPAPSVVGFITAIAAMIPFVAPIILLLVALTLIVNSQLWAAFFILTLGGIVLFIADHVVKPLLIGGAIQLPFLAVLFGILGGVENMGLLGLFLGPVIMVLFVTLWQEAVDSSQEEIYPL